MHDFWQFHGQKTRTRTRNTSEYGFHYMSGLLRMEAKRNIANVARKTEVPEQNMQHYISKSPWSSRALIKSIQSDIMQRDEFQEGSILILDESADEKSGEHSAGAGRQHNGRLGKVDMSQVGVFLSLANKGCHTWVDGELYLPKHWFNETNADRYRRAGIPKERTFQTKIELGLNMIKRTQTQEIPFAAVDCDSLYGRKGWFRDELNQCGIEYYADVPANTLVYLNFPIVSCLLSKKGQKTNNICILSPQFPLEVRELQNHPDTFWHGINLRPNERGFLKADFARRRVWTVREDGTVREEWLLMRHTGKKTTYSLSNTAQTTRLTTMASRKSQRYFIERSNQDAKTELGWDEFQAIKYRAWEHQLALTIAASWFIAETRLDWAWDYERDPQLLEKYETDVLPALSVANVRELLRAVMPLPQLSPTEAACLVVKHLENRTRSRKSRLRNALIS